MREINDLIVHCSATFDTQDVGAAEIRRVHVEENGWKDIGYHYIIRRNGVIETGRPIDEIGAHTKNHNATSCGICLAGGLAREGRRVVSTANFTVAQYDALYALLCELRMKYPSAMLHGHSDYANKACPCFDVRAWWKVRHGAKWGKEPEKGEQTMKKSVLSLLTALTLAVSVAACNADDVAINARNSLRTAQITYVAAMSAARDARAAGLVTESQYGDVLTGAVVFVDGYLLAVDMLDTYITAHGKVSEGQLNAAVTTVTTGLGVFINRLIQLGIDVKNLNMEKN